MVTKLRAFFHFFSTIQHQLAVILSFLDPLSLVLPQHIIPFWNQHTKPCNMKLEKGGKCDFLKIINFYSLPLYVPQLTLCRAEHPHHQNQHPGMTTCKQKLETLIPSTSIKLENTPLVTADITRLQLAALVSFAKECKEIDIDVLITCYSSVTSNS